jgi:DNA-binding transcriptional ArsR family regulator
MPTPRDRPAPPDDAVVVTEAAQLRALAHPLRLRLLGLLRLEGPSTASRLAGRTGESSGLTSYHLRQLAASGFVTDAPAPGDGAGGRERWWRAAHRYTWTSSPPPQDLEAVAAAEDFERVVVGVYAESTLAWLQARPSWPQPYVEASSSSDVSLRLTAAEMTALRDDLHAVVERYRRHDPDDRARAADGGPPDDAVVVTARLQVHPEPGQTPPPGAHDDADDAPDDDADDVDGGDR